MKEGGPAFPVTPERDPATGEVATYGGMSLRDYFAAQAPPAPDHWLDRMRKRDRQRAKGEPAFQMRGDTLLKAVWAYEYADAMLEAREA